MLAFFHGWRRKMGVATLVFGCVFMALWVRSYAVFDSYEYRSNTHLDSNAGALSCVTDLYRYQLATRPSPIVHWNIPYWSIVLPLTLLSAYLLLSKPRSKSNQSDDAQNPSKTFPTR